MKYTKSEFARKCGISLQYLNNYVRREKIIVAPDGRIDDEDELNNYFMEKRLYKIKGQEITEPELPDLPDLLNCQDETPYDRSAEKGIVQVMVDQGKKGKPFPVIPVSLAHTIFAEYLRDAYCSSLRKEIQALRDSGHEVTQNMINKLVKHYTDRLQCEIKQCWNSLEELVQEIIEDNS